MMYQWHRRGYIFLYVAVLFAPSLVASFGTSITTHRANKILLHKSEDGCDEHFVEAIPTISSVTDPEAIRLKQELMELASETKRGFVATRSERERARKLIFDLTRFNPTKEPAFPYYETDSSQTATDNDDDGFCDVPSSLPNLSGKWTLIYTDAPDITGLDTSRNPLATAKLGRIGQECDPPFIKNVIEWRRPDWADDIDNLFSSLSSSTSSAFVGNKESRILQKVCTEAKATPDKPKMVNLKLAGLDLVAVKSPDEEPGSNNKGNIFESIQKDGLPVGLLSNNPIELRGPLTSPFGQFEILFLDEELRIIRTSQNFFAVNKRLTETCEEWF